MVHPFQSFYDLEIVINEKIVLRAEKSLIIITFLFIIFNEYIEHLFTPFYFILILELFFKLTNTSSILLIVENTKLPFLSTYILLVLNFNYLFEITITKSIQNQKLKGTIQNKTRAHTDLSLDFFLFIHFSK